LRKTLISQHKFHTIKVLFKEKYKEFEFMHDKFRPDVQNLPGLLGKRMYNYENTRPSHRIASSS